jgi:hypothetical protein
MGRMKMNITGFGFSGRLAKCKWAITSSSIGGIRMRPLGKGKRKGRGRKVSIKNSRGKGRGEWEGKSPHELDDQK